MAHQQARTVWDETPPPPPRSSPAKPDDLDRYTAPRGSRNRARASTSDDLSYDNELPDLEYGYGEVDAAAETVPARRVLDTGPPPLPDYDDIPLTPNAPQTIVEELNRAQRLSLAGKKERRTVLLDFKELEAGKTAEDGESRFDWRDRSLSQRQAKAEGERWFPDKAVDRVPADKGRLEWGLPFFDELRRYKNQ